MTELNELVVVEKANVPALFAKNGCDPLLERIKEEVGKVVSGTFGGRFKYFNAGKFEFIAYTD